MIYDFIDQKGTFTVKNPQKISYLYFPLTNSKGTLLSSISPNLAGDIKKDNDHFLTPPAGIEDVKNNPLCKRDFFLSVESGKNRVYRLSETKNNKLEAGFFYHKLIHDYPDVEIQTINFIPHNLDVEVMWIKIKNKKNKAFEFTPTSFIPLYGRGENNLRDHRHVTSLFNRVHLDKYGIFLKPTLSFREQGHKQNKTTYFVLGYKGNKIPPLGQFPTLISFCGEGGNLIRPEAVFNHSKPQNKNKPLFDGKETCAAFRFPKEKITGRQETNYVLIMGITEKENNIHKIFKKLDTVDKVNNHLEKTKAYWQDSFKKLCFDFNEKTYNGWLKWVTLQPTLRKLFGCSFLPHFDYGKGGRGWRDLWQDALNLLNTEPETTKKMIVNSFRGVRIDGSNATIITKDNMFISDRNKISRVWMDHGVWPCLTLLEYIHRTSDLAILLKEIPYFRDCQRKRAKTHDAGFNQNDYNLRTKNNKIYKGTVLEHVLIENLVQFFNVGKHNIIKLENADWNDGLDMAPDEGESVAFSCMYADNINSLCSVLEELNKKYDTVELLDELSLLLDKPAKAVNYGNWRQKQKILELYLEKTKQTVSGKKKKINIKDLISGLKQKSRWLKDFIGKREWLNCGIFNGYYDNRGQRAEGKTKGNLKMMLASQVFPIMSGIASPNQTRKIWKSTKKYLKDSKLGGFRLNTPFEQPYMEMGRAFGFSYGDKENGAFFNHMTIMFAYALYKNGFTTEGAEVLDSVYQMSTANKAKIYPMVPEYFNSDGRGLYFYLTGSASWYIHSLLRQVLGINYSFGDLILKPKLSRQFFPKEKISTTFTFRKKIIELTYIKGKKAKQYKVSRALLENKEILPRNGQIIISKNMINKLKIKRKYTLKVFLT